MPQGSILGALFFFIYINDLTEGLATNTKLFTDDTSLFSVVHDTQTSLNDLSKDLEIIITWAFQWKMNFNPDPTKQAYEVILVRRQKKYPPPVFTNISVSLSPSQKYLSVHSITPLPLSAGAITFSPMFWKGGGDQNKMNAWGDLKSSCHRCLPRVAYYVSCEKRLSKIKYGFEGATPGSTH